jgi:VWFA-related protein
MPAHPLFRHAGARAGVPLLLLFVSGTHPSAQQPAKPDSSSLTELVDFLAVSDSGKPVTDLAPGEVSFKIDGRPRAISSLQFIELASATPADRTSLSAPLPVPYGSNRLDDAGRLVLIAMDRESIRPGRERPAREAALRFLSGLSPRDRVGLASLPRVEVELTNDHEQVRDALMRMTGLSPQEHAASDAACRGRLILNTLASMLQSLAAIDGPKTIAFISSGIMPPTRDAPMTGPPGQCEIRTVYFDEVAAAASAARAHFYVIQPNDEGIDSASNSFADPSASRFRSADDYLAGLQSLAGVTGGELYRLHAVEASQVFTRVANESSAYYVIAFVPEPGERDGLPHRVEVRVSRERVTLRTRPHFTIARIDPKAGAITPQRMLREARQFRDLPLRATAYSSLVPGDSRIKVVAVAEPVDPSVALVSAAVGLFDVKGKLVAQWTADREELAPRPMMSALVASPGSYRMRFAAVDASGRLGTVDYGFRGDLASAGALKLSAMVLGTMASGAFKPRLQFGPESAGVGYFEIYGVPPRNAEITVRMEIAASNEGPAIVGTAATVQNTQDEGRRLVIAPMALNSLPPGDYLVRAIVRIDGREAGRVTRTLRKIKV